MLQESVASSEIEGIHTTVEAVLDPQRGAQALTLTGGFVNEGGGATYNTLNLIVREGAGEVPLFQAGPSGGIECGGHPTQLGEVIPFGVGGGRPICRFTWGDLGSFGPWW